VAARHLQPHQRIHKQILQQDTNFPPPSTEEEGPHAITQYLAALWTVWVLLKYAGTLPHSTANTTRNKWVLIVIVLASNTHIVDAATIQNINHMILQNAAQIKILDCFTAYQQRQHLGGYDSEEEAENTPHYNNPALPEEGNGHTAGTGKTSSVH
jgi:hypothetical protein